MSLAPFIVRPGPQEYECRIGVMDTLPERLRAHGIKKAILVHGNESWANAKPFLDALFASDVELTLHAFVGESTYAEVARISERVQQTSAQAIIGVGSGKLVDVVKHVAEDIVPLYSVVIPTLASNCAPWAPLSVMYSDEGVFEDVDWLKKQVGLLLVDPRIIVTAPEKYLVAGIGDTIAKWYESEQILAREETQASAFLQAARGHAYTCKQVMVEEGAQAVADRNAQRVSDTFVKVAETIIALSGLVGGFGDAYARATIAHAIHDAITAFPETHHYLHGTKVAYGVMVNLAYEHNWDEIDRLVPFYTALGLPKCLDDLDIGYLNEAQLRSMADDAQDDALLKVSMYETTPALIYQAVKDLEAHFAGK